MARHRILKNALSDEVKRAILRESLNRHRNGLMDDEERMLLQDRIGRLRRSLGATRPPCAQRVDDTSQADDRPPRALRGAQ